MDSLFRLVFFQILKGFTPVIDKKYNRIYFKHLSHLEMAEIEFKSKTFEDKARDSGLLETKELEKVIIEQGLWSVEKEKEIGQLELTIKSLEENKKTQFIQRYIDTFNREIQESQKKLITLKQEKFQAMPPSLENFIQRKSNELYILNCFHKDNDTPLFSEEEFFDLEQKEMDYLLNLFHKIVAPFEIKNIKKIALSPLFLNYFSMCDDNPYYFYGKAVTLLTYYQLDLFSYGKYFKNILSKSEVVPPTEVMEDPDKLIEWHSSLNNVKKVTAKMSDKGAGSIVGATNQDLERLGLKDATTVDLTKEAQKHGGTLDMQAIMKLHGLK